MGSMVGAPDMILGVRVPLPYGGWPGLQAQDLMIGEKSQVIPFHWTRLVVHWGDSPIKGLRIVDQVNRTLFVSGRGSGERKKNGNKLNGARL